MDLNDLIGVDAICCHDRESGNISVDLPSFDESVFNAIETQENKKRPQAVSRR